MKKKLGFYPQICFENGMFEEADMSGIYSSDFESSIIEELKLRK